MLSRSRPTLENAIKRAIVATGMSVNAVALKSGVSQPILQRFLAGKRGITLHTADRLCAYLKLELTTIGGEY
ncbi:MAG TPA: helix-turn-helix transcriptional regulator [Gemmataceae bacterium]|nr:helix-turn-helix transcriptional regulator [Gemmataceae bacterium]